MDFSIIAYDDYMLSWEDKSRRFKVNGVYKTINIVFRCKECSGRSQLLLNITSGDLYACFLDGFLLAEGIAVEPQKNLTTLEMELILRVYSGRKMDNFKNRDPNTTLLFMPTLEGGIIYLKLLNEEAKVEEMEEDNAFSITI